jgi:hypothetical protein
VEQDHHSPYTHAWCGQEQNNFSLHNISEAGMLPLSDECGYKPILLQPFDEANCSACNVTHPTELV